MIKATYKFLRYMVIHKWLVGIELVKQDLWWQAITHDLDKFWPTETIAYIYHNHDNFKNRPDWQEYRQLIQLHHNHLNKHHSGYWVDDFGKAMEMPKKYLQEMIIDWKVASRLKGNTKECWKWYYSHKPLLGVATRQYIEKIIKKEKNA